MTRCSLLGLFTLALLQGCAATAETSLEEEGSAEEALPAANALTANALTANALTANALTANALTANALTANAMSPLALSALADPSPTGDLTRTFFRYVVSCALDATQSFSFTWTDAGGVAHPTTYPGSLGIAPDWARHGLDPDGRKLVSACLGARTNWYGVTVALSVRSPNDPLQVVPASEIAAFPVIEGAFWGDLFDGAPRMRACYDPASVEHARSLYRDCAAGHVDIDPATGAPVIEACGLIEIAGSCSDLCQMQPSKPYYKGCGDSASGKTKLVITTALP